MAYELISTVQVGSGGASTIEFTGIPQTANHLAIAITPRSTTFPGNTFSLRFRFNDSTSNYFLRYLEGSGSGSVNAGTFSPTYIGDMYVVPGGSQTGDAFGNCTIFLPNYSQSTKKQVFVQGAIEGNNSSTSQGIYSADWNNSSGITKISMFLDSGNFEQNTIASIYLIS